MDRSKRSSLVKFFVEECEGGKKIGGKLCDKNFCIKYESLDFQLTDLITQSKKK